MLLQYYCNISFLIFGIWISSALNFELVLLELCISEDVIIALQKKKKKTFQVSEEVVIQFCFRGSCKKVFSSKSF